MIKILLNTFVFVIFSFNCLAAATAADIEAADRRTAAIALLKEIAETPTFPKHDPRIDVLDSLNIAQDIEMQTILLKIAHNPDHNFWENAVGFFLHEGTEIEKQDMAGFCLSVAHTSAHPKQFSAAKALLQSFSADYPEIRNPAHNVMLEIANTHGHPAQLKAIDVLWYLVSQETKAAFIPILDAALENPEHPAQVSAARIRFNAQYEFPDTRSLEILRDVVTSPDHPKAVKAALTLLYSQEAEDKERASVVLRPIMADPHHRSHEHVIFSLAHSGTPLNY